MRLNPLKILTNKNFETDKKIYFISGNELTLIEKIKSKIIENYRKKENVVVLRVDSLENLEEDIKNLIKTAIKRLTKSKDKSKAQT